MRFTKFVLVLSLLLGSLVFSFPSFAQLSGVWFPREERLIMTDVVGFMLLDDEVRLEIKRGFELAEFKNPLFRYFRLVEVRHAQDSRIGTFQIVFSDAELTKNSDLLVVNVEMMRLLPSTSLRVANVRAQVHPIKKWRGPLIPGNFVSLSPAWMKALLDPEFEKALARAKAALGVSEGLIFHSAIRLEPSARQRQVGLDATFILDVGLPLFEGAEEHVHMEVALGKTTNPKEWVSVEGSALLEAPSMHVFRLKEDYLVDERRSLQDVAEAFERFVEKGNENRPALLRSELVGLAEVVSEAFISIVEFHRGVGKRITTRRAFRLASESVGWSRDLGRAVEGLQFIGKISELRGSKEGLTLDAVTDLTLRQLERTVKRVLR